MHEIVQNLLHIEKLVKSKQEDFKIIKKPIIIAVSKTFKIDKILPLIDFGHIHFGENKVQEALDKWTNILDERPNIKLHLIGKLQTNKVKFAIKLFDFIHSVDNQKLAKKICEEEKKQKKKIKVFIQVNISNEIQKSGVEKKDLKDFYIYCTKLGLDVIGLIRFVLIYKFLFFMNLKIKRLNSYQETNPSGTQLIK